MSTEQMETVETVIEHYVALYVQFLDEPDAGRRAALKAEMQENERQYGLKGEWFQ